jgi:hypothetical protein
METVRKSWAGEISRGMAGLQRSAVERIFFLFFFFLSKKKTCNMEIEKNLKLEDGLISECWRERFGR